MSPPSLRRYRAKRLLRKEFSALRSKVLTIVRSQLLAKGVTLDSADLEACYAQAWQGLYATVLEGEEIENPSAWLVLVTFRRAIDESRSAARHSAERHFAAGERDRSPGFDPDLAGELDDRARLRQVFEGLRTSLSERECEAASLCYLQGLSRAEAAERMGISELRMRKLMEGRGAGVPGVAGKVGGLLDTIKAGGWCEQQSSLMRAFAFGVLEPGGERHTLAVAHCRDCPACRAHVASLRGLATVLPLPLLASLGPAGGIGTAGAAAGGSGTPAASRVATAGLRSGGRAASTGWGGLGGSLAAKLTVTALVVLGGGYAVLGSRAHGSPPVSRSGSLPPPAAGGTLSRDLLPALPTPLRGVRAARRTSTSHAHSSHRAQPRHEAATREFGPERVLRAAGAVPAAPAPAQASFAHEPSRAAREFGIE